MLSLMLSPSYGLPPLAPFTLALTLLLSIGETTVGASGDFFAEESDWAPLWLHYDPVSLHFASELGPLRLLCPDGGPVLRSACSELQQGLEGMLLPLGKESRTWSSAKDIFLQQRPEVEKLADMKEANDSQRGEEATISVKILGSEPPGLEWPPVPAQQWYHIKARACNEQSTMSKKLPGDHSHCFELSAATESGALYGAFRVLHLIRTENQDLLQHDFSISSKPSSPLRMWNLWDNVDGTIERGYAGLSIFNWTTLPKLQPRYVDYARLLASVGINGIVWNNVNACGNGNERILETGMLTKLARLAKLFADYGIWSFMVPCFASPITIGNLGTADPLDPSVLTWWTQKVEEAKTLMPSFRGFLVKVDTEGQPGPEKYNRTELEGANMFGRALEGVGGIAIWRCFAHPPAHEDQAFFQFNLFHHWDGQFLENVVLQVKNGPFDFQVREPVHSLIGRMPKTNMIMEMQATQEYTGQARHLVHLPSQWEYYLRWELGLEHDNLTVGEYLSGEYAGLKYSGIAAVSNLGNHWTWAGHEMSVANTYGFGRLAWDPTLSAKDVTEEWVAATWGIVPSTRQEIVSMLLPSWEVYENYTAPLGVGYVCSGDHYHMNPPGRQDYLNATEKHVGRTRWDRYGATYLPRQAARYGAASAEACPEEMLLGFHNVPYSFRLPGKGNMSVIEYIYSSHRNGARSAAAFEERWLKLQGSTSEMAYRPGAFADVAARLADGAKEAAAFSEAIISFFENVSRIPAPPLSTLAVDEPVVAAV